MKKLLTVLAITLVPQIIFNLIDLPFAQIGGLFLSIVILWFSEIVPLALTGLLIPLLAVLFGVAETKEAFSPFGNQILFLFMGSFFLAKAMEKHKFDKRVAYTFLSSSFGANSLQGVLIQVAVICWFLSMWISNTATCAIMVPIILGLMETLKEGIEDEKEKHNLAISFLLTSAFASSIGGMATPVGSPPNLMAMQFLKDKGIELTFLQWMGYGLPVSLAMLITLLLILKWRYPLPKVDLSRVKNLFAEEKRSLGPMSKAQWQILSVFTLAITLWVIPGTGLPMGAVGILASSFLFMLKDENGHENLTWKEASTIDWGTIWLFGGGLAMGSLLDSSGLANHLGQWLFSNGLPFSWLAIIVIITGVLLSEFSSNTASTAIIVPLLLGATSLFGQNSIQYLVIAAAFGASFGFMLPVSTPPNAIVYGTGRIKLKEMIVTGSLFDILGTIIIWLFFGLR